jgi:hypothetical protein
MLENNQMKKCIKDIAKHKMSLILRAKRHGMYEDFGAKEMNKIRHKYDVIENWKYIREFEDWCMNYSPNY